MKKRIFLVENTTADSTIPWGGRHITILGYSDINNSKDFKELIKGSVFENNKRWTISSGSGAVLEKWNGVWTIVINHSKTLGDLSTHLNKKRCANIKGPDYSRTKWHITLTGFSREQANKYLESCLRHEKYYSIVECIEKDGKFIYNKL